MRRGSVVRAMGLRRLVEGRQPSQDSLDKQIDALLVGYERDCIAAAEEEQEQTAMESLVRRSLRSLLEAPGDRDDDDDADPEPNTGIEDDVVDDVVAPPPDDETDGPVAPQGGESDDTGNVEPAGDGSEDQVGPPPGPPIDVGEFAMRVSRLVDNHDSLLDVRTVIVNRALAFVARNHGDDVADKLKESLAQEHDIDLDDPDPNANERPMATGAGPAIA